MIVPSYPDKKVARPSISAITKVWQSCLKYKPEVIHITADGFSHMFSFIGTMINIPINGSFHTDLLDLLVTHNANWFQKWCVSTKEQVDSLVLDSCATTSTSFSKKLALQGTHCEHVIITGVDNELFNKDKIKKSLRDEMMFGDKKGFLCVYVGRISREKRLDVMVEAVKQIDGAYLAIVGDGPSADFYASLHGKENRVYCKPKFLSHDELAEFYASSDIHVSASEFETLGNTVLESFSCCKPVVVPRTQGFLDTVKDEHNGFFFTPGDSESAKNVILKLKNDKKLVELMGKRGRESVENRSISRVVLDLLVWYDKGRKNRNLRSFMNKSLCMLLIFLTLPFGIIALGGYNIIIF
jgi:glycosyltransferase involved in cell wall biosynthesis